MTRHSRSETSLPRRYCRCTSIIGLASPHCQIHGNQQRQDSLTDQLRSVVRKANEMGCYDAADWITSRYEAPPSLPVGADDEHTPRGVDQPVTEPITTQADPGAGSTSQAPSRGRSDA